MNNENKSYMHVALVLDASGSMSGIRESTIASLREFFDGLKSAEDKTCLDVWQFDGGVNHLIKNADLASGIPQALEQYTTGGSTALFDAICTGIDELGAHFAALTENERPDGVVFAILTDGFENASRLFTREDVRQRIAHQTEKYNWEFRFLAANQDACLAGEQMGLPRDRCHDFHATKAGIGRCFGRQSVMMSYCMASREVARQRRQRRAGQ